MALHPAEHRALRELYLTAKRLEAHWSALARRMPADRDALEAGAREAGALVAQLPAATEPRGLHGRPAATSGGATIGRFRSTLRDRFLERNQALRLAVHDSVHVVLLLGYAGRLAAARGDEELATFLRGWRRRLDDATQAAAHAAEATGDDPDAAIEPLSPAQRVAYAVGALGEWDDSRRGGRERESTK